MNLINPPNVKGKASSGRQPADPPPEETAVFTVLNDKGLHTRPATELVRCTARFRAQANLCYQGMKVNAKSLLGILMLAAGKGAKITIEANGVDARQLIDAVLALVQNRFNIRY